jgi:NAD(P)-dependent dehydrogenase (short-subunit alcohol dehydrogenase family)
MITDIESAWVVGLGGIGNAIKKFLQEQGVEVSSFSRQNTIPLDITSQACVAELVQTSKLPDAIIITAGMLHDKLHLPEKSISTVEKDWLYQNINVNVLPTLYFAKALTKRIKRNDKIVLTAFSARVSSISDNRLGGWHSYRMSKCMLNMLIKNIAIEWNLKSPDSIIFGYHPGTVDTDLSKPFQKRIPKEQLFSVEKAASHFWECLSTRTSKDSGKLFDWRMNEITP